jgi:uncharacterized protein with HEPN domain
MNGERVIEDYLHDIQETILKIRKFLEGVEYHDFIGNDEKVYAVIRALEIIGEAAKHIPDPIRDQYADIPWRAVAGMRDKLIHEYFGVNLSMVWQTVQEELPQLYTVATQILQDLKRENTSQ